ncbi:ABC transporter ATP-binding protein [Bacillus sp. JCM 19041]|uniref:ATP-binding cassette domain-containing protein n=1 Tax=Bacillus sp. JCM 19041 TaxID=1460637 RepID=UPI0006D1FEF0
MGNEVEFKNVGMSYKKTEVIKDISFKLEEGKIYGLLGRNGAGKTSMLSLLAGYRQATEGTLLFDGNPLFENENAMEAIGFYYQSDNIYEARQLMNIRELIDQTEEFRPNFDKQYAENLAKKFKLPLNKKMSELSKGMQASVSVVLGLASRLPITVFDEVYLGMDAPTRNIFYKELLDDYEKHPRTVVLSTHLVSEMDYLFEEILIIDKGSLIINDSYESIVSKGATITGSIPVVDEFVSGLKIVNEQTLGPTKSVAVYGRISKEKQEEALQKGLELGSIPLQDLFIYLTEEEEEA